MVAAGPGYDAGTFGVSGVKSGIGGQIEVIRYRRLLLATAASGRYWEVGSGGDIAWSAGIRAAAVPVQAEIGVQRSAGSHLLSVGARERFVGLVGTGSPPWDVLNSFRLVFGVRFGAAARSRRSP